MGERIAVLDGGYQSYAFEKELLAKHGYSLELFDGPQDDWYAKVKFAENAIGVFVRWMVVNNDFFAALPGLRAVVRYGVGYDNIDLDAATKHNVKVANVQGYANHAVSDHALALMFACARSLKLGQEQVDAAFTKPPRQEIFEFHDKTLGIIGLGRIGGTLCAKARWLFQYVLAYDPYISDQRFKILGAVKTDLETVLQECHVISLHCNLTDETHHMIDLYSFEQMVKQPIIINTSRGAVIDTPSLQQALDKKLIHSAGLDVYETEPPDESYFSILTRPNVFGTGHYAWYSDSSMLELQRRAAKNMLAILQGQSTMDCLN
ncbi:hypothetical protein JW960_12345 [candidate division KSB1 bacterium]|nr:hypothetical protein [candidate division KSB1 bacterium]